MSLFNAIVVLFRQAYDHEFVPILPHLVVARLVVLEPTESLLTNTCAETFDTAIQLLDVTCSSGQLILTLHIHTKKS